MFCPKTLFLQKEKLMALHSLVRYVAQNRGKFGVYCDEEWCVDGRTHVFRNAVSLPFGGGWQTLRIREIGPCDGKCKTFTTSNGKETRTESIDPECVYRFDAADLPSEFRDFVRDA